MNLLDAEDMIKSLPDQALMQQAQMPTGEIPQFLVISEIKNRADMRKRYEAQLKEQPQGTVAEQVMREGIAGMMPQQGVTPQMGQQPPQGGPQMPPQGMPPQGGPQGMPPQGGPQGMPPQGMPPQGMPPQMPPQGGPQGMPPQMPPQGMPPQGMPPGMPPMGMAAGGIVRMDGGGFLDQYVTGAESGPMPGGSTIRDQIDRVLESGMSYPEILSFISEKFYSRPEALEYVQSKLGRLEPTMSDSMIPEAREMLDREPYESREARMPMLAGGSDIYKAPMVLRAADALGRFDSFKQGTDPERMAEPAASALARQVEEQYATPDLSQRLTADMLTGAEPVPSRVPESLPQAPQTPRSGGIRNLFGTGFGGADYSSPKPGVESADPISEMLALAQSVQTDASDPRRESKSLAGAGILSGSTPSEIAAQLYDYSRPTSGARGRPVEGSPSREELIYGTLGEDYSGFMPPVLAGPAARQKFIDEVVASGRLDDRFGTGFGGAKAGGKDVQGGSEAQAQSLSEIVVDRDRKDLSGILSKITSDGAGDTDDTLSLIDEMMADLRGRETQASPTLDLSDILARSDRMTKANILMQLGSGIAGGDVAKGIEKAGMAGVQGAQEAAKIEMAQRISQTKAGQEDIRRGEQRDLDIAKLGIQREQVATMDQRLKNELSKAERVSKGQLFNLVSDLVQEATGDMVTDDKLGTVDKLSAYFMQKYAPLLGIDLSKEDLALLGRTYGGAGGGAGVDPAQFDRTGS